MLFANFHDDYPNIIFSQKSPFAKISHISHISRKIRGGDIFANIFMEKILRSYLFKKYLHESLAKFLFVNYSENCHQNCHENCREKLSNFRK
jgi:hypothetical protein